MKLFGHPIHIMLIHFPSALFPMDLVCSLLTLYTGKQSFAEAGNLALIGGSVLGWAALVSGTFDLLMLIKNKPSALRTALIHGGINATVLFVFSILAYLNYRKGIPFSSGQAIVILKSILILLMFAGNFLGGRLILRDKVLEENKDDL